MKYSIAALMTAVLLLSCTREEIVPAQPESSVETTVESAGNYVPGEARVYLSEEMAAIIEEAAETGACETKSSGMNDLMRELGVTKMYRLFPHAGQYEERTRREGLHRWYVVEFSQEVALTKAETSFTNLPGVDIFEPVQGVKINDFNDLTSDMWGLNNTVYPDYDINVVPVWAEYTTGNPDVVVAVVDNGVDLNHEDLAANCLTSGHYNSITGTAHIKASVHGTHVAGTIAAVNNNGKGVAGVAGGDKAKGQAGVKIMSCQIFQDNSDGTTTSSGGSAAIKYAADNGAVIAQNSWGYNYDYDGNGRIEGDEYTKAMKATIQASDKSAVDYFIKYAGCDNAGNQLPDSPMKGGVVIFAAGNDAIGNGAPGSYDPIICVGSIASDGTRSSFSNFGSWVDICAPGSGILSTVPNNRYDKLNGTSMACPHVSGVAALLVSYFGGPGFTNDMLKEKIISSANTEIIPTSYQVGGLVDAYGAFVLGNDKAPAAVTDLKVSGRGNNIDMSWTVPADEDGKAAYGFLVIYGKDQAKVEAATPSNLVGVEYKACVPGLAVGEAAEFSVSRIDFTSKYYVKMLAYSYGRNYSAPTQVLSATTTENHAPEITVEHDGPIFLMPSQTLNIKVVVTEPDSHDFTVEHVKGSDAEKLSKSPDGTWNLALKGKDASTGTYEMKIIATDEYGMATTLPVSYEIRENSAPEKIKEVEDILLTAKGREFIIDMTDYVSDRDAEQLKYEITVLDAKVAYLTAKGDKLIGTALGYGSTNVTVVAKDARGEKVVFDFKVTVKDPSDPLSLYPNPVKDYLNVATLDLADTEITIANSTGKVMFHQVMKVSAQDPARIDMTSYVPGTYSVQVKFGGKVYKKNVVKL